jgi:Mce-associated membrane protein
MADHDPPVNPPGSAKALAARARAVEARETATKARAAAAKAQRAAEASDGAGETVADRSRTGRSYSTAMAIAVLVALAAGTMTVVLAVDHHQSRTRDDRDVAILQAARREVLNLLAVDKTDVNGYADRVLAGSTGEWHDEFTNTRKAVTAALADPAAQSTVGKIVAAGIESRAGASAAVLVSASTFAGRQPDDKQPGTSVRMRVNVADVGGVWKLSKVEIVR